MSSSSSSSSSDVFVVARYPSQSSSFSSGSSSSVTSEVNVFARYSAAYNGRPANAMDSGPESCPAAPPCGYMTIFREVCGIGFHQNLSWIMVELCSVIGIAPSQLCLKSWALIHALQVLADLSNIDISGSMVCGSFYAREIEAGTRRFSLFPRSDGRSPVELPDWVESTATSGEYFYIRNVGPSPPGLRHRWAPPGFYPIDPAERIAFPESLFEIAGHLRDSTFLLHPDIVRLSSLASTDESVVVPQDSMEALINARVHFDSISDVNRHESCPPLRSAGSADRGRYASTSRGKNGREAKRRRL